MRDIYIWLDDTHDITQKQRKMWAFDKPSIPQLAFRLNDIMCIIRWYISTPFMRFFRIEGMFHHMCCYFFIPLFCRYVPPFESSITRHNKFLFIYHLPFEISRFITMHIVLMYLSRGGNILMIFLHSTNS